MSDEIVWADPPMLKRGRGPAGYAWIERLSALIDHPQQWAMVRRGTPKSANTWASNLRRGVLPLPNGTAPEEWEFTSRKAKDDGGEVYARYLGPVAS